MPRFYKQSGVIYVSVLMLVVVMGIGMLKAITVWDTLRQRENEAQLLFVGNQFRQAIESYYNYRQLKQFPRSLEALLEDKRGGSVVRHLRKIYPDPMTKNQDWGMVKAPGPGGEIMGVYSSAKYAPMKMKGFSGEDQQFSGKTSYQDWSFIYTPGNPNPRPPAPPK
jgi:type II secretory pathway pseudopilin PulG